jgi:ribosomal-protein-alanine N-acetyltransferase
VKAKNNQELSPFKVRRAVPADCEKIYSIEKAVHANPWSLNAISEEIAYALGLSYVLSASKAPGIIGYIFMRKGDDALEIMILGIAKSYQKMGLGHFMVKEVLNSELGYSAVNLEVSHQNEGALSLYKKLGFKVYSTRKGYYKDGSDALCMRLLIAKGKSF